MRYAEIKGITLYPEKEDKFGFTTYWTVPPDKRPPTLEGEAWAKASMEERQASNEAYSKLCLYDRDLERDDPALVQVVEEMGERANGQCAGLAIEDVPKGARYRIDEYDGNERVMTDDSYEWKTAS